MLIYKIKMGQSPKGVSMQAEIVPASKRLKSYEVVVIVSPQATVDQQKEVFQKNKAIIESFGGSIFSLETWGRRTLANPIEKHKVGVYFHMMYQAQPAAVAEIERIMRISDHVIRFLHIALDPRAPMAEHKEVFTSALKETQEREKEREARMQARKAAMAADRG